MPQTEPHSRSETSAEEVLRRLEQRLERASGAAERLFAEAASEAASAAVRFGSRTASGEPPTYDRSSAAPPPQGWQPADAAQADGAGGSRAASDLELVASLWREARGLLPPELRRRLAEALRELLLAARALIDWYLERTERERSEPVEVEDIPVR